MLIISQYKSWSYHLDRPPESTKTHKMQFFVILDNDNGWKLLTYVTKSSISDIAGSSDRKASVDS